MLPWSPNNSALFAGKVREANNITELLKRRFEEKKKMSPNDFVESWETSLIPFIKWLNENGFSEHGLMLELEPPGMYGRLDALLVGKPSDDQVSLSVVEFKGNKNPTEKLVEQSQRQAADYLGYLRTGHSWLSKVKGLTTSSCVHFHNASQLITTGYSADSPYIRKNYLIDEAPLVFAGENPEEMLRFLHEKLGNVNGDIDDILEGIQKGFVLPTIDVIKAFAEMLRGHPSFIPLGDQSRVGDEILTQYEAAQAREKPTLFIVKGGPGTGKTVLAMHLLRLLNDLDEEKKREPCFCYAAPGGGTIPTVKYILTRKTEAHALPTSMSVMLQHTNSLNPDQKLKAVIIDEGHRLKRTKIADCIKSSRFAVLLLDELQAITPGCAKNVEEIQKIAKNAGYHIENDKLAFQLRYRGGEQWVNWVNSALEITCEDKCDIWERSDIFPAIVTSNIDELSRIMEELNKRKHHCRYLAGYCWKDGQGNGIKIADFHRPWYNDVKMIRDTWSVHPKGFDYVGAPYFSQNFEFDYVGVIIGPDLRFDGEKIIADQSQTEDQWLKDCTPDEFLQIAKNIYRMLMTRGRKGCFIHCEDPALREYLRKRIDPRMSQLPPQEIIARSSENFENHQETPLS